MMQTVILSFTPIVILLAQNGMSFYELMLQKQSILHKNELVMAKLFIKLKQFLPYYPVMNSIKYIP